MPFVYLILHNIRSVHNVGSIFRTADAAGVKKIFLCGYTPTPKDRFGRKRKDVSKVALGAEESVEFEYYENIEELFLKLKKEKIKIVAVEQDKNSIKYSKFKTKKDVAFVLGEERYGISKSLINKCDEIVEIPMYGKKESLNVSVTAGIILFRFIENFS